MTRRLGLALPLATALALSGCSGELETRYGSVRGTSINGTGVLANLFRGQGDSVRTAVRLTDELADWADVIVRFAPYPGPPEREEAGWYFDWLNGAEGRRLIYVVRDYDELPEYLAEVEKRPADGQGEREDRAGRLRDALADEPASTPPRPAEVADRDTWFAVKAGASGPSVCAELDGLWSAGIDPAKAALTRHETIDVGDETVLLRGDGEPLVVEWTLDDRSTVLVVANGSFLLNGALVNRERGALALKVVRWAGAGPHNVAFVEGRALMAQPESWLSVFAILKVPPFGWVVAQLLVLGLAACLARAPRLGRPRPDPSSGEDRPVAHALALGSLMSRAGQPDEARAHVETYRRWRYPSRQLRAGQAPAPVPTPTPGAAAPSPSESLENE